MELELQIMEIERFALHDGPGIRSVVFLQGCPLYCPWCANPESQRMERQLLHNALKCVRCGACAEACPVRAISFTPQDGPVFNRSVCTAKNGCGECAAICPAGAIGYSGELRTAGDIMAALLRDRDYYEESGGGVTFSGGEPFAQAEGLLELLRRCKAKNLHTAVETAGHVKTELLQAALPLVDYFLFDVKHSDAQILRDTTGADLALITENLRLLARNNPAGVEARVPVIPGFNDNERALEGIFALAAACGVKNLRLLPYHTLGKVKYTQLGRKYAETLAGAHMLTKADLAPFAARGAAHGLNILVG